MHNSNKKTHIFHPFIFSLLPILFLYSTNLSQVPIRDTINSMLFIMGLTFTVILVLQIILRNWLKTGIIASFFIFFIFSFVYVFFAMAKFPGCKAIGCGKIIFLPLLAVYFLALIFVILFVVKRKNNFIGFTKILNIASTSLLIVVSFVIIISLIGSTFHTRKLQATVCEPIVQSNRIGVAHKHRPDIYYIIFDRYANRYSLQEIYNFDNSKFIGMLQDHGFYVANESVSNYLKTAHSLASSLNLNYLNYLSGAISEKSNNWLPLYKMLQNNRVMRYLKYRGYTYVHLGSWWDPTRENNYADINYNFYPLSEFSYALFQTTIFNPLFATLNISVLDKRINKFKSVKKILQKISEVSENNNPTFVFAHILAPHPPHVFNKHGKYLRSDNQIKLIENEEYLEELKFINKQIQQLIEKLTARKNKPVIIIQSDEGPFPERYKNSKKRFNWENAKEIEFRQKYGILNSYYFPGISYEGILYPNITPVNSFRLVFNLYFGEKYEPLPDRSYAFPDSFQIYKFFDVSEKVKKVQ